MQSQKCKLLQIAALDSTKQCRLFTKKFIITTIYQACQITKFAKYHDAFNTYIDEIVSLKFARDWKEGLMFVNGWQKKDNLKCTSQYFGQVIQELLSSGCNESQSHEKTSQCHEDLFIDTDLFLDKNLVLDKNLFKLDKEPQSQSFYPTIVDWEKQAIQDRFWANIPRYQAQNSIKPNYCRRLPNKPKEIEQQKIEEKQNIDLPQ